MTGPERFYDDNYIGRNQHKPGRRDWFHRSILDRLFNPFENSRTEIALKMLESYAPLDRLLDVGCRDGGFLRSARQRELCTDLAGVDISEAAISAVRERGIDGRVVNLNRQPLPFQDDSFDAVTALAVVEHVFDPHHVIKEIARVIQEEGILIIAVPNVASFSNRVRILTGRLPVTSLDSGWDGGHLHYFTKRALDDLLEAHGFEVRNRQSSGGGSWFRNRWVSLLAGELVYLAEKRVS